MERNKSGKLDWIPPSLLWKKKERKGERKGRRGEGGDKLLYVDDSASVLAQM